MATPTEVIDLFADVREGSGFERARATAHAFPVFDDLLDPRAAARRRGRDR